MKKVINIGIYILTVLFGLLFTYLTAICILSPYADIAEIAFDAIFTSAKSEDIDEIDENYLAKKEEIVVPIENEDTATEKPYQYTSTVKFGSFKFPSFETKYGNIKIDRVGIDCNLYMGDTNKVLKKGAGTYVGGHIPGDGGTVLVAAHCTTYFRPLEQVVIGDIITIDTIYGDYEYEVYDIKICKANDLSAFDLSLDCDNLVLYTCYPLDTLKSRTQRLYVSAKLVSGTKIERE